MSEKSRAWEERVLEAIAKQTATLQMVDDYEFKLQNVTKNRWSKETDSFVNGFCTKLINEILKMKVVSDGQFLISEFLFSSARFYGQFMIRQQGSDFSAVAKRMLSDVGAPFYRATSSSGVSSKSRPSRTFQSCFQAFVAEDPLTVLTDMIEKKELQISAIIWFLALFYRYFGGITQPRFAKLCSIALAQFSSCLTSLDDRDVRLINADDVPDFLAALNYALPNEEESINDLSVDLAIVFANSQILEKQFLGLSLLRKKLSTKGESRNRMCLILQKSGLIQSLLKEMHNQLISDFSAIFKILMKQKLASDEDLAAFWSLILKQHNSATAEPFLEAFRSIYKLMDSRQRKYIWKVIRNSATFPIFVLNFFTRFQEAEVKARTRLFFTLNQYYAKIDERKERDAVVETMCEVLPHDTKCCDRVCSICMKEIAKDEGENVQTLLKLLTASSKAMSSEKVEEALLGLCERMEHWNCDLVNAGFQVLSILFQTLDTRLSQDQFDALSRMTFRVLETNADSLCDFYITIFQMRKVVIPKEFVNSLFLRFCAMDEISGKVARLIVTLFIYINRNLLLPNTDIPEDVDNLFGVDELWTAGDSSVDTDIIHRQLCHLYSTSLKQSNRVKFVSLCMKRTKNIQYMKALLAMIDNIQDDIDMSQYLVQNRFISENDMALVRVSGHVNVDLKVPKNMTLEALRDRIAHTCQISKEKLILCSDGKTLKKDRYSLKNYNTFTAQLSTYAKERHSVVVKYLPSVILSKERYYQRLEKGLHSKKQKGARVIFDILQRLPSDPQRKEFLQENVTNLATVINEDCKFAFMYDLNIIASLLSNGCWTEFLTADTAAVDLVELLLKEKIPAAHIVADIQLMMRVVQLILTTILAKDRLKRIITKEVANSVIDVSVRYKAVTGLGLEVLHQLAFVSRDCVVKSENLSQLIYRCVFHHDQMRRTQARMFIMTCDPKIMEDILIDLLPQCCNQYCVDFFEILANANPEQVVPPLVSLIYETYGTSSSESVTELLKHQIPVEFTNGVFKCFETLLRRNPVLKDANEVVKFLSSEVLFSPNRYCGSSKSLCSLLSYLIELDSHAANFLAPFIKFGDVNEKSSEGPFSPGTLYRGLRNLGATCYMNSTLQILYNIPEFRNLILSEQMNESGFACKLQMVFGKLLLFPTKFIDPSSFVKSFTWYGEPVNPYEQQDASEFIQILVDGLSSVNPALENLFKGIIIHNIDGIDTDFHTSNTEPFILFPLEIKEKANVGESLDDFLSPDMFTGSEQYNADGIGKINAKRTHCVTTVPTILIMQLKRFTFDMASMTRRKVNSRYEFPMELDMSVVMNTDNHVIYDLIAVQNHCGDANGGHYYSYVKTPNGWYEFNDRNVTVFDAGQLPEVAAGGNRVIEDYHGSYESDNNAYLLYYRKRDVNEPLSETVLDETLQTNLLREIQKFVDYQRANDSNLTDFIFSLTEQCDNTEFLLNYLSCLVAKPNDPFLVTSLTRMRASFEKDSDLCKQFMDRKLFWSPLVSGRSEEIRNLASDLVVLACNQTHDPEPFLDVLSEYLPVIMDNSKCLREVFGAFLKLIEGGVQIPSGIWIENLTHFLKEQVISANLNARQSVDLTSLFRVLKIMFQAPESRRNFAEFYTSFDNILPLLCSLRSIVSFGELISLFLCDDKKLSSSFLAEFKTETLSISPSDGAGLLLLTFGFSDQDMTATCFRMWANSMRHVSQIYLSSIFRDLLASVKYHREILVKIMEAHFSFWFPAFLLSPFTDVRADTVKLLRDLFPMAPSMDSDSFSGEAFEDTQLLAELGKKAFYGIPQVTEIAKSNRRALGRDWTCLNSFEYFKVMKWALLATNTENLVYAGLHNFLGEIKKIRKIEGWESETCDCALRFIHSILSLEESSSFFMRKSNAKELLQIFVDPKAYDSELLSLVLSLLPLPRLSCFTESKIFPRVVSLALFDDSSCFDEMKIAILNTPKTENCCKILWNEDILRRHLKNSVKYFKLSRTLFEEKPKTCNIFFALSGHEILVRHISSTRQKERGFASNAISQINALTAFFSVYVTKGKKRADLVRSIESDATSFRGILYGSLTNRQVTTVDSFVGFFRAVTALLPPSQTEKWIDSLFNSELTEAVSMNVSSSNCDIIRVLYDALPRDSRSEFLARLEDAGVTQLQDLFNLL